MRIPQREKGISTALLRLCASNAEERFERSRSKRPNNCAFQWRCRFRDAVFSLLDTQSQTLNRVCGSAILLDCSCAMPHLPMSNDEDD